MTCLNILPHHSPGKTGKSQNSPFTLAESLCQDSNLVPVEYKPRMLLPHEPVHDEKFINEPVRGGRM
jgi:hypothetical protein